MKHKTFSQEWECEDEGSVRGPVKVSLVASPCVVGLSLLSIGVPRFEGAQTGRVILSQQYVKGATFKKIRRAREQPMAGVRQNSVRSGMIFP